MAVPHESASHSIFKWTLLKIPGDRNREMKGTLTPVPHMALEVLTPVLTLAGNPDFLFPPYLLCIISQQMQKSYFGLSRLVYYRNTEQTPVVCSCASVFPPEQSSLEWPRTPRSGWHKGQRDVPVCVSWLYWLSLSAFNLLRAQKRGFPAASAFF